MFKKFVTVTALSLLLSNPVSASYVYDLDKETSISDVLTLTCDVSKVVSEFPQEMNVKNIIVIATINSKNMAISNLKIFHHLNDGTVVSRSQQYPNATVSNAEDGRMNYIWKGNIENSSLSMEGHLLFENKNAILYAEESFQRGKVRYTMFSSCNVIDIEEPHVTIKDKNDKN